MTESPRRNPFILPLDMSSAERALEWVRSLGDTVGAFKVGLELVHATGPDIFARVKDAGGERIFYDAKLCDIPNTVAGACRSAARLGV